MTAGDGDDSFEGFEGNDVMNGGADNDTLIGGAGSDILSGAEGNDVMNGGADIDLVLGGADNDTLLGEAGDDFLLGEAGNDTLSGGLGNDALVKKSDILLLLYTDDSRSWVWCLFECGMFLQGGRKVENPLICLHNPEAELPDPSKIKKAFQLSKTMHTSY